MKILCCVNFWNFFSLSLTHLFLWGPFTSSLWTIWLHSDDVAEKTKIDLRTQKETKYWGTRETIRLKSFFFFQFLSQNYWWPMKCVCVCALESETDNIVEWNTRCNTLVPLTSMNLSLSRSSKIFLLRSEFCSWRIPFKKIIKSGKWIWSSFSSSLAFRLIMLVTLFNAVSLCGA